MCRLRGHICPGVAGVQPRFRGRHDPCRPPLHVSLGCLPIRAGRTASGRVPLRTDPLVAIRESRRPRGTTRPPTGTAGTPSTVMPRLDLTDTATDVLASPPEDGGAATPDMATPDMAPAPPRSSAATASRRAGETCDPPSSCPTSCPAMGCQLRELVNPGTCQAACPNTRLQTACANNDGCCPAACNGTNDSDCAPRCGNGVVERGETCEPVAECNRRQAACQSDANTIRTGQRQRRRLHLRVQSVRRGPAGRPTAPARRDAPRDPNCLPRPDDCTHIEWCVKPVPAQPGPGDLPDRRRRPLHRRRTHRRVRPRGRQRLRRRPRPPIQYVPPIGGRPSG